MYNGIGLPTPRGSGTNGFVQRNLAFISNIKEQQPYKTDDEIKRADAIVFKEPNKEILEHERKRKVEVKCFELEQEMEEQGYTQAEIDKKVGCFRKKLLEELKRDSTKSKHSIIAEQFDDQHSESFRLVPKGTHESAAVNILKNSVFKEALGIGEEFKDGNSVELANQRKKEDAETKRLVEVQKDMKTLESSEDESDDEDRRKHRKHKSKKRKRTPSPSHSDKSDNSRSPHSGEKSSHSHKHKSHKSHSKKSKHSHSKEKRRH